MLTRAESTGYRETSLHADVMRFVADLDALGDPRLHVSDFGRSPGGRELPLVVVSTRGVRTPAEARAAGLPVVLMLDGIHPGEVEGKEASLALVRDLLAGHHPDWLSEIVLLVVPLFNPDGNDALDPANRRLDLKKLHGQPGPVVGTRTQSQGINLNRDYLRQAAPEMRLLQAGVCQPWAPDLTIDNHATNGSVHRFHMTVDVPHTVASGRAEPIEFMRARMVPDVMRAVRGRGFESGWYGNFVEDERTVDRGVDVDPTTAVGEGWMTYPHHPRFGSNYRGLTNRLDLLLECYSYLTFEERVRTSYAWLIEMLRAVARRADEVLALVAASRTPPERVAVSYRIEARDEPVHRRTTRRSGAPFRGAAGHDAAMRAIRPNAPGTADVLTLTEVELAPPGPGQAQVAVAFAGVNFIDVYQRSGQYPLPAPLPLGREGAGVVTAVRGYGDTCEGRPLARLHLQAKLPAVLRAAREMTDSLAASDATFAELRQHLSEEHLTDLVLTIAAERLEMTRLMRRAPLAPPLLESGRWWRFGRGAQEAHRGGGGGPRP
mgnify:CR=1 FL=1